MRSRETSELFRFPMPADTNPPKTVCFKMEVPDDPEHISNLMGALWQLCYGRAYQNGPANSVKQVIQTWRTAYNTISFDDCDCPPPPIQEDDYEMSLCEQLRYHDGKLQAMCCGVWADVTGQPAQGVGNSQPGASPQPAPGGGCQDYMGNMGGGAPWYVPTIVSSGDTISVHDTSGLFFNAGDGNWHCPDGSEFFLTCTGIFLADAGCQRPDLPSGRLIAQVGADFYDVLDSVFTIPAGHTNEQVTLQMNTGTPAGSAGDVSFTVTVCNNATPMWSEPFDFTLGPSGFVPLVPGVGKAGVWTGGIGWVDTTFIGTGGEYFRGVIIKRDAITPFTITRVSISLDYTKGAFHLPTQFGIGVILSNGDIPIEILNPAAVDGAGQVITTPWAASGITSIELVGITDTDLATPAGFTGADRIYSLTIEGTGANPFI